MAEQLRHQDWSVLSEDTLKAYLRPLFSKSRPKTVTASGRKAEFPEEDDPHRGLTDETREVKPWKYADHRAITVFHWVVLTATVSKLAPEGQKERERKMKAHGTIYDLRASHVRTNQY